MNTIKTVSLVVMIFTIIVAIFSVQFNKAKNSILVTNGPGIRIDTSSYHKFDNDTFTMQTGSGNRPQDFSNQVFLMKVVFSFIFCVAALFVILSKDRFDEETKKWAFSVLTLIAGVWIGSIT